MNTALWAAISAFSMWGLFPLYWKFFTDISSWDLFAFRLFFSFFTLFFFVLYKKKFGVIRSIFSDKKKFLCLSLSAVLISSNWLIYIYAVNVNRVLEASMGYFLNPIILIILGRLIFKDQIRKRQVPAIILVGVAISYIAYNTELATFPWIALSLSLSFGLYGLIRKLVQIGSIEGLFFETMIITIPSLILWPFITENPLNIYMSLGVPRALLLSLSGLLTGVPLILFAYAAKNLKLTTLGFTQYLSPSFKFLCGILVFNEALLPHNLVGFTLIWIALLIYSLESLHYSRKQRLINRKNL